VLLKTLLLVVGGIAYYRAVSGDYWKSAKDARGRSNQAKKSSKRHSNDLIQMRKYAADAAERVKQLKVRRRKVKGPAQASGR
jgi:hypothetical protein